MDLQPIGPIEGVHMIQGDITSEATARQIISLFEGEKAELIVCDGAPDGKIVLKVNKSAFVQNAKQSL